MLDRKETSLVNQIYEILETTILTGEFKPGDILELKKAAMDLRVNTGTVRDALIMLEKEGLVDKYVPAGCTGNGSFTDNRMKTAFNDETDKYRVIGITSRDIEEMFNVKSMLEVPTVKMAASKADETDMIKLNRFVEAQEHALAEGDASEVIRLDSNFHYYIYELSGSMTYRTILSEIHAKLERVRKNSISAEGRAIKSIEEHKEILKAIESGDAIALKFAVEKHVANAFDSIKKENNNGINNSTKDN